MLCALLLLTDGEGLEWKQLILDLERAGTEWFWIETNGDVSWQEVGRTEPNLQEDRSRKKSRRVRTFLQGA